MSLGIFWLSVSYSERVQERERERARVTRLERENSTFISVGTRYFYWRTFTHFTLCLSHERAKDPFDLAIRYNGIWWICAYKTIVRRTETHKKIMKTRNWKRQNTHRARAEKNKQHHTYLSSICDMKFKLAVAESVLFTRSLCKIHVAFSRALLLPAHTLGYIAKLCCCCTFFYRIVFLWSNVAQNPNFLSSNEYWLEGFWFDANIKFGWVRDCFF